MIYCYIDFEFNQTKEARMNVLCVAYQIWSGHEMIDSNKMWLKDPVQRSLFADTYMNLVEKGEKEVVFVAYAAQAECRALLSLDLPIDVRWLDLYLEYRMLLNNNYEYMYGKQYIKGVVKRTYPPVPKYERTEEDASMDTQKPEYGLAAACYKLLGKIIDTDHKTAMRDLIISNADFDEKDIENILAYCESDIAYLRALHIEFRKAFRKLYVGFDKKTYITESFKRGDYARLTAVMEAAGYPIDVEATRNFASSVPDILHDVSTEINELFPKIAPFELAKNGKYVRKEKKIRDWIEAQNFPNWMPTATGKPSLSLDAFTRYYSFSHDYPTDNFGAQMVRFLKLKQSLNGFLPPAKGKKSFWDYVGSDGRVRPYMGIYGSQTARSQPAATGFIPLKAAWMRSLIRPKMGRAIMSMDYSQQEFLIAAILSKDKNMVKAYLSGDVYLHTAKLAGAVPKQGTKKSHVRERDLFKSTVLGIQYQMGAQGLANKISNDTGEKCSVERAEELIDSYRESYPDFEDWRNEIIRDYRSQGYLKLPCGWTIWGDNPNMRSVGNFPIQGAGSSVMREAVRRLSKQGICVIYTLHDAIYIEFDQGEEMFHMGALYFAMQQAFQKTLDTKIEIRLDPALWGPGYDGKREFKLEDMSVVGKPVYIDPRSYRDYMKFYPYFFKKDDIKALQMH